jgi:putative flippase GtrA
MLTRGDRGAAGPPLAVAPPSAPAAVDHRVDVRALLAHPETRQLVRYLMVATVAFAADYGVLVAAVRLAHVHYLAAAAAGFVVGLAVNFVLSERHVFAQPKVTSRAARFTSFGLIGLVGLGLLEGLMYVQVDLLGWDYRLAKLVATGIGFVWNYSGRRLLYQRRGAPTTTAREA